MDSQRLFARVKGLEYRGSPLAEINAAYDEYCAVVEAERAEMAEYVRKMHERLARDAESAREQ